MNRFTVVPTALEEDKVQVEIDQAFQTAIYAIKGAVVMGDHEAYDIIIHSRNFISDIMIKIAPLQRPDLLTSLLSETLFQGLLLRELSEFYILEVQGQKIVIKINTKDIPAGRDDAVYKSIIDTKSKFISYISFMLSEDYATGILEEAEALRLFQNDDTDIHSSPVYSAVYEKMLKAVHQNPNRLKEIADIIKRLDPDIIGQEFLDMYQQFEQVVRRQKK